MLRVLDALGDEVFDVLVLGGGITGAGIALDAALRGFRVALIDKGDFASATSSLSSKLIHGGLRYLEHGDVRLVYEALHERGRLLHNAPHLVRPLSFLIPFYDGSRVPPWKWRLGLTVYDLLAGQSNVHRSLPLSAAQLLRRCPELVQQRLRGGASYADAQMDDARLCLAVIRTAVLHGAVVANYVEAIRFDRREGNLAAVQARDVLGRREIQIRARQIVNATGPWVDDVLGRAGDASGSHLRPTKGVHLVLPDRRLHQALLLLHPADGRVFFVIPWLGKTLVGTTDTLTEEGPDGLSVTEAEIGYLLEGFNACLQPPAEPTEVLNAFAGLRPLIRARPGEPSKLSREFQLFRSPSGLLSIAGGKYTTYRHMAQVVVDEVARGLGRRRVCRTQDQRLVGAPEMPWPEFAIATSLALQREYRVPETAARHLVDRYGTEAAQVASYLKAQPELAEPVLAGEPDLRVELVYHRDQEMALRPADFLLRRTRLGLFHPDLLEQEWPQLTDAACAV